jgi:16S rRNA (adenine1518-N6/adenine1519-N6)-dimethyltransferase
VKRLVGAAFAHRRKTLPNSLELAGVASRADAMRALERVGLEPTVRAEALEPPEFVALAKALA